MKVEFLAVLILCGCSGINDVMKYDVEEHYDSVLHITREELVLNTKDSVSHTEYMRGDTMFVNDFRYLYRERVEKSGDSLSSAKKDSVFVKEPIYIEKQLSLWERFLQKSGIAFLSILALLVSYFILRIFIRKPI